MDLQFYAKLYLAGLEVGLFCDNFQRLLTLILWEVYHMDTSKVGSNIDAWCTKCKLILAHTIEAIAHGTIKRVQCNTCGGKHQFKAHQPGSQKVASPNVGKIKSQSRSKSKACDFSRLIEKKDVSLALGYCISHKFVRGDLLDHAKFGLGVVVEEKDHTKIEVLFESGPKVLVHSRK